MTCWHGCLSSSWRNCFSPQSSEWSHHYTPSRGNLPPAAPPHAASVETNNSNTRGVHTHIAFSPPATTGITGHVALEWKRGEQCVKRVFAPTRICDALGLRASRSVHCVSYNGCKRKQLLSARVRLPSRHIWLLSSTHQKVLRIQLTSLIVSYFKCRTLSFWGAVHQESSKSNQDPESTGHTHRSQMMNPMQQKKTRDNTMQPSRSCEMWPQ